MLHNCRYVSYYQQIWIKHYYVLRAMAGVSQLPTAVLSAILPHVAGQPYLRDGSLNPHDGLINSWVSLDIILCLQKDKSSKHNTLLWLTIFVTSQYVHSIILYSVVLWIGEFTLHSSVTLLLLFFFPLNLKLATDVCNSQHTWTGRKLITKVSKQIYFGVGTLTQVCV